MTNDFWCFLFITGGVSILTTLIIMNYIAKRVIEHNRRLDEEIAMKLMGFIGCKHCNHTGRLESDKHTFDCPICQGRGFVEE